MTSSAVEALHVIFTVCGGLHLPSQDISSSEQDKLDEQVEEYRIQLVHKHAVSEARFKEESERLREEIRLARESRVRLRTVSVGSSAGLSLSNNSSITDSLELSREEREGGRGEEGEGEEEGGEGEEGRGGKVERGGGEEEGEGEGEEGRWGEGVNQESSATDEGTTEGGEG